MKINAYLKFLIVWYNIGLFNLNDFKWSNLILQFVNCNNYYFKFAFLKYNIITMNLFLFIFRLKLCSPTSPVKSLGTLAPGRPLTDNIIGLLLTVLTDCRPSLRPKPKLLKLLLALLYDTLKTIGSIL